jgi:tRNA G18 (ribose-2'-O)-methylase SpoU
MRKLTYDEIDRLSPAEFKLAPKHRISVVLQDIRSIHNVGSMFRTADAAAIEQIVVTGVTGTPEHRGIRKTALGAEESVAWRRVGDPADAIRAFRDEGYTVAALEIADRPKSIADTTHDDFPLLLVVGNEVNGLSNDVMNLADFAIEIPQYGTKQSLNVAVAFGVAIFGLVDRYRHLFGSPNSP